MCVLILPGDEPYICELEEAIAKIISEGYEFDRSGVQLFEFGKQVQASEVEFEWSEELLRQKIELRALR